MFSRTLYPDGTWNKVALGSVRTMLVSFVTCRSPLEVCDSVSTTTFSSGEVQVSRVETNGLLSGRPGVTV